MMTREQAIKLLEYPIYKWSMDWDEREDGLDYAEAIEIAIAALRPVGREQVEKARWIKIYEDGEPAIEQHQIGVACSKCMNMPKDRFTESKFCPNCGRPMTDEAVEMVMERLEALKDGKGD